MSPDRVAKIKAAIRMIEDAEFDALPPEKKQFYRELFIADRAISRFRICPAPLPAGALAVE